MKATIKWTGDASFSGEADSGHTVVMDGAPEFGGRNQGHRPMELVLIGMGGCTAFDVVSTGLKSIPSYKRLGLKSLRKVKDQLSFVSSLSVAHFREQMPYSISAS